MTQHRFCEVDVFTTTPLSGNPVALIYGADAFTTDEMSAIARWTNLSETTFILQPSTAEADYRVRMFGPGGELPFAGHPTLGSAHDWFDSVAEPAATTIVQECPIGLVPVRRRGDMLAFRAPGLLRSGPVDNVTVIRVLAALGIPVHAVAAANWVDTGPGWIGLLLESADQVLAVRPDFTALESLSVGIIGPHKPDGPADYEVRAFAPTWHVNEDPVSGSLNAGLAHWLTKADLAPPSYTVRQGTAVGKAGDVIVTTDGLGEIWIGGRCSTIIAGSFTAEP